MCINTYMCIYIYVYYVYVCVIVFRVGVCKYKERYGCSPQKNAYIIYEVLYTI